MISQNTGGIFMSIIDRINSPNDIKNLTNQELKILSEEIRKFLIDKISKTGGHIASNLGVVELTLALHKEFNSPKDKIIWDVGHQSYVHKIITGRKDKFHTLRKLNGISGFTKRVESEHDVFNTGHSSTSISAALGIAKARDVKGEDFKVVAVIGDGAMCGGMAFEALNDVGHSKNNMIIVLNDNEMSIAKNVGGLSRYLSKIRTQPFYYRAKMDFNNIMQKIPSIGDGVIKTVEKAKGSIKYLIMSGAIFEDLGLTYLGPIDGHNITELVDVFNKAKNLNGPILIHVVTKKGKGYSFAEDNPDKFHGIGSFEVETGETPKKDKVDYSGAFGEYLTQLAKNDKRIVAITAAMTSGTGLGKFAKEFPNRFFDVGIAEQHAVTLAAGLATQGLKPVLALYSTFLQRAYDQVLHDVALQKLPVIFAIDRAGIVGADGETHHGVFDISFLGHIPNMTLMAPRDYKDLQQMLEFAVHYNKGPIAIRYPRGNEETIDKQHTPIEYGKSEVLKEGNDMAILAVGKMTKTAINVSNDLEAKGVSASVINVRFLKPIDEELVLKCIKDNKKIVVIEDNVKKGGYGSSILEFLNEKSINYSDKVKIFAFPDQFITHGDASELYKMYGLDKDSIVKQLTMDN